MDNLNEKVIDTYLKYKSILMTSKLNNLSRTKVRKILITEGVIASSLIEVIKKMQLEGITKKEICKSLQISSSLFNDNTGYFKGMYHQEHRSKQALRSERFRIREAIYKDRFKQLKGEKKRV